MASTILADVKLSMGISSNDYDADITATIASAKQQMSMSGLKTIDDTDPLTALAIQMYCKSNYNFQGDSERWQKRFEQTINGMAKSTEYGEEHEPDLETD